MRKGTGGTNDRCEGCGGWDHHPFLVGWDAMQGWMWHLSAILVLSASKNKINHKGSLLIRFVITLVFI